MPTLTTAQPAGPLAPAAAVVAPPLDLVDLLALTELTAMHRCDQTCPAQAYVLTAKNGSALLWCNHHFARNEAGLAAAGFEVKLDERYKLEENHAPSPSANAI